MYNTGLGYGRYQGDNYPQGLPFGVYEYIYEDIRDENISAGTTILPFSTVPSGEIWVITQMSMLYTGGSPGSMYMTVYNGIVQSWVMGSSTIAGGVVYEKQAHILLVSGELMRFEVYGGLVNDKIYGFISGYKMKVDGN